MKPALALTLCLVLTTPATAQTFTDPANLRGEQITPSNGRELPLAHGAPGLQQLLRKLNTRASLMNIVAHPDDEDGGMLTLYSRGLGARVADLSLNRGEGGQNAMTADFEEALGLLRTQELLAADRYTGVDQFFGTEVDFGFSKTKAEAFKKWTHERVLYDVVRAIRIYRPLVLVSNWIGNPTDGHGQHQAAGQIAQEAFLAAGNPKVFPELTAEGILPWQPLRIYARVPRQFFSGKGLFDYATGQYVPAEFTNYVTGTVTNVAPSTDVIVHEGTPDPLLTYANGNAVTEESKPDGPLSYIQFARIGLGLQKSQVNPADRQAPQGAYDVDYHLYGFHLPPGTGKIPASDPTFFTGIDTSLEAIAPNAPLPVKTALHGFALKIQRATKAFNSNHPEALAPQLADALKSLDATIGKIAATNFDGQPGALHELRIKRVQLNDALVDALGLSLSADNSGTIQIAGRPIRLYQQPHLVQNLPGKVIFLRGHSTNSDGEGLPSATPVDASSFALGHPLDFPCDLTRAQTMITRPYFHRDNIEEPVYTLDTPALRNAPATPPALTCWAELDYQGARVQLAAITVESFVPPLNLGLSDHAIVLPRNHPTFPIGATVDPPTLTLRSLTFDLPQGWSFDSQRNIAASHSFTIHAANLYSPQTLHASAIPAAFGASFSEGYKPVCYPGIACTNYFTPAAVRVIPADLNLPSARRIAYLPGTGDSVVQALRSLGIQPHILALESRNGTAVQFYEGLKPADLADFDTIILGVRTYSAHPELHGPPTQALFDYARHGGNVLVQFQTPEFTAADAPYPLSLGSNEKVVDETAPVTLIAESPLLAAPNRITPADFDNWIEERGHGFLSTWDDHYTALLEVHDPGEPAEHVAPQLSQRGGLITTQLGSDPKHLGRWTYCAYALYRQLPEAIPGAFRLFADLINP